ncbi:myc box-dependent-interacting protein 1 isoform X2 [Episyrphus balteatus]|uniref:myc box-dependent-interacting protein 1 isoform X2 n=1 Tax=Episyrphus balteatus TaxID=286459 RepID=UPI002484FA17|nr:myc box-dependent-interacting protein 1 isoform X2 [Episyrphus balteatus]
MAESKGVMLAKSVQKHAGRAKEKILHNLGKVDRTADEIFDDHLNNFTRQQNSANKLQKEFGNYIRCVRAIQAASKSLMDAICEVYEPHWNGYDALTAQASSTESLWLDFSHKLTDQVLIPLCTYTNQFPEMKKKVEKRNRKLIDYDGQRHSFQSVQASASKRKDDVKITKSREQLEEARRTYEILNTELHDELPALYDSRILFLVTNLQTLFASEQVFHTESAKIFSELETIVDKLATDSQRGNNTLKKSTANAIKPSPVQSPVKQLNNTNANNSSYQNQVTTNGSSNANSPSSSPSSQLEQSSPRLDSISPTPDTTPIESVDIIQKVQEQRISLASSGSPPSSPTSSAPRLSAATPGSLEVDDEPSYQNTDEIVSVRRQNSNQDRLRGINNIADNQHKIDNETLNSPNANSPAAPPAAPTQTDAAVIPADSTTTIQQKKMKITETTTNDGEGLRKTTTTTTTTTTTDEANNAVMKTTATTKQVNGNGNIPKQQDDNAAAMALGGGSATELPPGVLYRVKATYGYVKEDADELSFEIGDIIRVIEYDDPEDQEEGWLMGQKEGTQEKGLFPANFTRPI